MWVANARAEQDSTQLLTTTGGPPKGHEGMCARQWRTSHS